MSDKLETIWYEDPTRPKDAAPPSKPEKLPQREEPEIIFSDNLTRPKSDKRAETAKLAGG